MDAGLKHKLMVGAVSVAVLAVGYHFVKAGAAPAQDASGGLNSPVMFVPGGGGGSLSVGGSGGGTGLIDSAANTGPTFSSPLTDLSTSPIPVYPLSSDAVMASAAAAQASIASALTTHLSDNATTLLSQVVAQFKDMMPSDFSGAFSTIGGNTNFDWHATGLSVAPTPVSTSAAPPPAAPPPASSTMTLDPNAQNELNSYLSMTASNAGAVPNHGINLQSMIPALRANVYLPAGFTDQQIVDEIHNNSYWSYIGAYYNG